MHVSSVPLLSAVWLYLASAGVLKRSIARLLVRAGCMPHQLWDWVSGSHHSHAGHAAWVLFLPWCSTFSWQSYAPAMPEQDAASDLFGITVMAPADKAAHG